LSVDRGEIVTILGPSGSGKSTLMNMIGGIEKPNEGSITVDGIEISSLSSGKLTDYRRDQIGFIFQFYNLIPNLNVYENVEIVSDICDNPLDVDSLLETLGIAEQRKKYPVELSGGQQQRVAIARAVVKNPQILLCDEPTGALDSKSSLDIIRLIKEVNKKYGTTVLIITHNAAIAGTTDRTVRLKDGRIVQDERNASVLSVDEIAW
jgi:putative ABC transport system ATP-binding protein